MKADNNRNNSPETLAQDRDPILSNSLTDLAARIRVEHEACCLALMRGLQHAVAAGKLLIEAKAQLRHGQWGPWLREHCGIPERTARHYMQIAPYAADDLLKSANLADLAARPPPTGDDVTFDDIHRWGQAKLDGPFIDDDFDDPPWLRTKLLHQAQLPAMVATMLEEMDEELPLLRLVDFDDLEAAAIALAPIASGKRALKIDTATADALIRGATEIRMRATYFLGGVLYEIERRCDWTEEKYQREWDETHAAWMAQLDARIAKFDEEAVTAN